MCCKLDALVHEHVHEHFCQFPNAESYVRFVFPTFCIHWPRYNRSLKVSRSELDRCKENAQLAVESVLELESVLLFKGLPRTPITSKLRKPSGSNILNSSTSGRQRVYTQNHLQTLRPILPEEERQFRQSWKDYEDELVVVAHVQAYVAYKVN